MGAYDAEDEVYKHVTVDSVYNQLQTGEADEPTDMTAGEIGITVLTRPAPGTAGEWNKNMNAKTFEREVGGLRPDNTRVLNRTGRQGGLIACLVNPSGGTKPWQAGGRFHSGCRLQYHTALVASGLVDLIAMPEAHVDVRSATESRSYIRTATDGAVHMQAAPTSKEATVMELATGTTTVKSSIFGGIMLLMSKRLAACIEGVPQHQHYMSGRILKTTFNFEEGRLHIIVVYGVSSPTSSTKRWISAALFKTLSQILQECAPEACLVMMDGNVAQHSTDRREGVLTGYDTSPSAPWRAMEDAGFDDVFRHAIPQGQYFTYVRGGKPVSRIDTIWANKAMLNWEESDGAGVRAAITSKVQPMSADHLAVLVSFQGPFTPRHDTKRGTTVAVSALPIRFPTTEAVRQRYTAALNKREGEMQTAATELKEAVKRVPEVSCAMDLLGLGYDHSMEEVDTAVMAAKHVDKDRLAQAQAVLHTKICEGKAQLRQEASEAMQATSKFLKITTQAMRESQVEAMATPQGKSQHKANKPTVRVGVLQTVVERWHAVKKERQAGQCPSQLLQKLHKDVLTAGVLQEPPATLHYSNEWEQWADGAMQHAKLLLSAHGLTFANGQWAGADTVPNAANQQKRMSTSALMSELTTRKKSGGAVDALMVDYDPITGEPRPCMTHDGLVRAMQATLADWTVDKAVGDHAYALTAAFHSTLFTTTEDRRGLRRAHLCTTDEAIARRNTISTRAKELALACTSLNSGTTNGDMLQKNPRRCKTAGYPNQ